MGFGYGAGVMPGCSKQQHGYCNGVMTPAEFKARWESDDVGGGITFEDIARCYEAWGLGNKPRIQSLTVVTKQVLQNAGIEEE